MRSFNSLSPSGSSPRLPFEEETERCKVFVGHVPLEMNECGLVDIFKSIGPVKNAKILRDRLTGQSRECAYICFSSEYFAKKATKIRNFFDPISKQRMVVNIYNRKIAGRDAEEMDLNWSKPTTISRRYSPNFVQIDDIFESISAEVPKSGEPVPESHSSRKYSLDDTAKEMARREHLEEIEDRTSPGNKAIFVGRFMPELNEWHIREHFSHCGTITFVKMFSTAFRVEFAQQRMAAIAIREMNGKDWGITGRKFICDWWSCSKTDRMQKLKRCSKKQRLSKSPIRQKSEGKKEEKKLRNSEDELYLPLTKKTVPPPPALYEYLSTSEKQIRLLKRER
uniref:RRM domain-containing protein n=1 Tax=Globodera rostochiensis TaxID=31243 RepID=A0A914HWD2_GLORO